MVAKNVDFPNDLLSCFRLIIQNLNDPLYNKIFVNSEFLEKYFNNEFDRSINHIKSQHIGALDSGMDKSYFSLIQSQNNNERIETFITFLILSAIKNSKNVLVEANNNNEPNIAVYSTFESFAPDDLLGFALLKCDHFPNYFLAVHKTIGAYLTNTTVMYFSVEESLNGKLRRIKLSTLYPCTPKELLPSSNKSVSNFSQMALLSMCHAETARVLPYLLDSRLGNISKYFQDMVTIQINLPYHPCILDALPEYLITRFLLRFHEMEFNFLQKVTELKAFERDLTNSLEIIPKQINEHSISNVRDSIQKINIVIDSLGPYIDFLNGFNDVLYINNMYGENYTDNILLAKSRIESELKFIEETKSKIIDVSSHLEKLTKTIDYEKILEECPRKTEVDENSISEDDIISKAVSIFYNEVPFHDLHNCLGNSKSFSEILKIYQEARSKIESSFETAQKMCKGIKKSKHSLENINKTILQNLTNLIKNKTSEILLNNRQEKIKEFYSAERNNILINLNDKIQRIKNGMLNNEVAEIILNSNNFNNVKNDFLNFHNTLIKTVEINYANFIKQEIDIITTQAKEMPPNQVTSHIITTLKGELSTKVHFSELANSTDDQEFISSLQKDIESLDQKFNPKKHKGFDENNNGFDDLCGF